MWVIIGCHISDREWQSRYDSVRKKLWYGSFEEAFQEADQNYRKSEGRAPAWSTQFQTLKAQALLFQGQSKEALALLEPEIPSSIPLDARARKKIVQGDTLCRLGDSQTAEPLLADAEGLISRDDRGLRADLALTRGRCALSIDRAAAKRYYSLASNLAHGSDEFVEATGFLNLGFVLLNEGHYDEGSVKFLEGLKVTASPLLKEKMLGNLGFAYSQLGELRRAIPFSQQAESLAAEVKSSRDQMKWLIDLGREHFSQLEYSEAETYYGKALAIARSLRAEDDTAICLNNLAQLALRTNDLSKAEDYTRQLEALEPKGGHYLDLLLNQAELAKARQDFSGAERLLNQMLQQMTGYQGIEPAVRWKTQSDLAAVYVAQGKFRLAEDMFRRAVTTAEAARSNIEGVEYKISFLDQAPFYDEYVRFLVSRNRPVEALGVAEMGRSPTLSEGRGKKDRGLNLERIQDILRRERRTVLAYWLGWQESYLWVITPAQVKLFHLPAELEIENEVEAYDREIVDGGKLGDSQKGENLYRILVSPAEKFVSKDSGVIIVPHRKLYDLNFETIVVPAPKPHYWIEDVHSQNVNFIGALASSRPTRSQNASTELLLVGAPVLADKRYPVLKHAEAEMGKVASHFPAAHETTVAGRDATPQAYLASQPARFHFLHFVTHGRSSTVMENPLDAAIILSPDRNGSTTSSDPEGLYSLYGKDIMKTPLHAELVTVSACYGLGREYSGEGLVGLAWAFMRAGAHQVVAALWEVDDASTPQLMDDFYGELSQGKPVAEALRDAKLKMLHSGDFHKRPYYWASLQLYTGS